MPSRVAARAGVNVETLRYYERRGLIEEPVRGINGHRDYDEETVRFWRAVRRQPELGSLASSRLGARPQASPVDRASAG